MGAFTHFGSSWCKSSGSRYDLLCKNSVGTSSCKMLMPPSGVVYAVSLHVKWTRRCPLLRPPLSCTGLITRGLTRGGSISIMGTSSCCCCCCCRHIKRPSESAQSRGWASDADVFRGHRLTALMWGKKGNNTNQNRTRIQSHLVQVKMMAIQGMTH